VCQFRFNVHWSFHALGSVHTGDRIHDRICGGRQRGSFGHDWVCDLQAKHVTWVCSCAGSIAAPSEESAVTAVATPVVTSSCAATSISTFVF
jgi:hypothetical protein